MPDGEMTSGEDDAAFRRLYEDNVAAVYRYVAGRQRNPGERADIADVVADVFAVAWRRRSDRPAGATERFWLFGVARRVLADHWRSDRRRRRLWLRMAAQPSGLATPGGTDSEMTEQLEAALGRLKEKDREVLRLVAWDELDRTEAADAMGCSVNAFNIRLHRALRRLSTELGPLETAGRGEPR
jgi:RNA polymerase sigma-70 factor (ECF subfamily)